MINAINNNKTWYINFDASIELKDAIAKQYKQDYNLNYDLNEIIVGTDYKQIIFNLFLATLNSGNEVILYLLHIWCLTRILYLFVKVRLWYLIGP